MKSFKINVATDEVMPQGKNGVKITGIRNGGIQTMHDGEKSEVYYIDLESIGSNLVNSERYRSYASNTSKLGELVKATLGKIPTDLMSNDLIGKNLVVYIEHNVSKTNGKTYANVVGHDELIENNVK